MPDWTEISEDDLLNYGEAHTGQMARYDRIMRRNTNIELRNVHAGLHDVKVATMKSAEKIEAALKDAEKSSNKFQKATIALTLVIAIATAIYTWVTWISVQINRDANQLQKELIEFQKKQSIKPSNKSSQPTAKGGG